MGDDDESVVGLDEAQRELLIRIKAASNGPEHAKRRIEGLDKMVKNLKHRRHLCAEAMNKDAANIAWIDAELQRLESQYRPLCARLEEREERMKSVETNLELAERTMLQIMGTTKTTARSGIKATALMLKNEASSKIAEERGFSMAPSTTFHPSKSSQHSKK